jgi:hypothetical protein
MACCGGSIVRVMCIPRACSTTAAAGSRAVHTCCCCCCAMMAACAAGAIMSTPLATGIGCGAPTFSSVELRCTCMFHIATSASECANEHLSLSENASPATQSAQPHEPLSENVENVSINRLRCHRTAASASLEKMPTHDERSTMVEWLRPRQGRPVVRWSHRTGLHRRILTH